MDHFGTKKTDLLSQLSSSEKAALFDLGTRKMYTKDEMIYNVGSTSEDIYIVLDGRIKIFELSKEGKEVILWFCFPGEIFGLSDALSRQRNGTRDLNAQSCSYVELISIKHDDFLGFLKLNPAVSINVIDILSYRLRELGSVLLNLASDDVTSRVAKLIARLATRYGKSNAGQIFIDIPLTHQQMADMIGTSRQTVTTVLGSLKRKGILKIEQRNIIVCDYHWLDRMLKGTTQRARDVEHFLTESPATAGF